MFKNCGQAWERDAVWGERGGKGGAQIVASGMGSRR